MSKTVVIPIGTQRIVLEERYRNQVKPDTFAHTTANTFMYTETVRNRVRAWLDGDRQLHGDYDAGRRLGRMTSEHPRWTEFLNRLAEACNFRPDDVAGVLWDCEGDGVGRQVVVVAEDSGDDTPEDEGLTWNRARRVLAGMGSAELDIQASLAYFGTAGVRCDCELVVAGILGKLPERQPA